MRVPANLKKSIVLRNDRICTNQNNYGYLPYNSKNQG